MYSLRSTYDLEATKFKKDSIFASTNDLVMPTSSAGGCIFHELQLPCHILSELSVKEQRTLPSSHGWSRCRHCSLNTQTLQLNFYHNFSSFMTNSEETITVDLSWSLWDEYFFSRNNDQYKAYLKQVPPDQLGERLMPSEVFYVKRPVFIIPMITLHPGKPLFFCAMSSSFNSPYYVSLRTYVHRTRISRSLGRS